MEIGEIWRSKENDNYIIIESFALRMSDCEHEIVTFNTFLSIMDEWFTTPALVQYGTEKEIEEEYSLFATCNEINKYENKKEFFNKNVKIKSILEYKEGVNDRYTV